MAKKVYHYSDFCDMMEKYNPFALKNEKSEIMLFDTYKEVYEYTMKRLYDKYPRGFIDLVLFVHEECGIPFADAEREVKSWRKFFDKPELLLDWNQPENREYLLRKILFSLHLLTETDFNEVMFKQALVYLETYISTKSSNKDEDNNQN